MKINSAMKNTNKLQNLMNIPSTYMRYLASSFLTMKSPEHSLPECMYRTTKTYTQRVRIIQFSSQNILISKVLHQLSLRAAKIPNMPTISYAQLQKKAASKKNLKRTATSVVLGSFKLSESTNGMCPEIKSSLLDTMQESGSISKPKLKTA